ncbi:hypothetical protein GDO78_004405 [Eleutherodactylus coqui]|uniref:Uncharacterized protein n=1 Tax=Eleutherodactylus coqui TaxID=57060 RepID=A0A8J6ES99_ELECQ|nr:hypothetical protein GDO78_004405 [Eleutherodactylus coqui]
MNKHKWLKGNPVFYMVTKCIYCYDPVLFTVMINDVHCTPLILLSREAIQWFQWSAAQLFLCTSLKGMFSCSPGNRCNRLFAPLVH